MLNVQNIRDMGHIKKKLVFGRRQKMTSASASLLKKIQRLQEPM